MVDVKRIGTWILFGLLTLGMAGAWAPAQAGSNLVVNGDFEQTSLTTSSQINTTNVTGWSTSGYNFLYFPGQADTTGAQTVQYGCCTKLWGPGDGSNNGLTPTSPTGGNFVGADGAFSVGAITQTVTGLTIGTNYTLSFWWAAGQQQGYTGATTEAWNVSFGSQNYSTVTVTTPSMGFTPWRMDTVVFQATATSQVLSFLAAGTPGRPAPVLAARWRLDRRRHQRARQRRPDGCGLDPAVDHAPPPHEQSSGRFTSPLSRLVDPDRA